MASEPSNTPGLYGDPGWPRAKRLEGRVAIVTGAGSRPAPVSEPLVGNGKATAVVFARAGAKVALLDAEPSWAESTRQVVEREGGEAILIETDVASDDSCQRSVQQVVSTFGRLDILVNNVGVTGPAGNAVEVDPEAWDRAMRINVTGMVLMSKYALPHMLSVGGGSIINLSSAAGLLGGHPSLLYPTSKAAVIGLTRAMAAHHGRQGVRVNAIAPGRAFTPMVASRGMTADLRDRRRENSLLGVEGTAWDIAYGALFLASDESRWITGIVLPIDAGRTAGESEGLSPRSDAGY
jgi:NAD(P)-dependent dehydrogenase (short-subunit alcohol dehydrogenase family)